MTSQSPDLFFQQLFDYTVLEKKEGVFFEPIKYLQSNDLIFFSKYFIFCREIIKDSQKYIPEFLEDIINKNKFFENLIVFP